MSKFKRASLEGSDELFRPTRAPEPRRDWRQPEEPIDDIVEPRPAVEQRLKAVRLTADEIDLLIQAIQVAKYPERVKAQKLPLFEHERYDAVRAKLQNA
ncbi:MAG: hypothetical protein J2P58_14495, partial [Acidimicrobiaceae bacterium]|nr:hypothetical protein [Acidimicrobiaceae bacterium]